MSTLTARDSFLVSRTSKSTVSPTWGGGEPVEVAGVDEDVVLLAFDVDEAEPAEIEPSDDYTLQ
jgi:hypothetical protein